METSVNDRIGISKGSWWGGIATLLLGLALATFHLDSTITNHEDRLHAIEIHLDRADAQLDKLIASQAIINQQQAVLNATVAATLTHK